MTYQERFAARLQGSQFATAISVATITGTACPCATFRGTQQYNVEYHKVYATTAEDCGGTGILVTGRVTTTVAIKAVTFTPVAIGSGSKTIQKYAEQFGQILDDDLMIVGAVKTSDGSYYDLTALTTTARLTIGSAVYSIINSVELPGSAGALGLLRRVS